MLLEIGLILWLTVGVACYAVLLVGAFRARKTGRGGYGWMAVVLAPLLVFVAPFLVLRAYLHARNRARANNGPATTIGPARPAGVRAPVRGARPRRRR